MADDLVLAFKSICNFVKDMNFAFGDKLPNLQKYAFLLEKTGIMNEEPVRKHVAIFSEFTRENEEAILQSSVGMLRNNHTIRFSDKVLIDLSEVIQLADTADLDAMWTHLLTILAILHPENQRAKEALKERKKSIAKQDDDIIPAEKPFVPSTTTTTEDPFAGIGGLFQGLLSGIDTTGDPASTFQNLLSSPLVSNVIKNLGDGDMDINKIMDGMQQTLSTLQEVIDKTKTSTNPPTSQ